MGAGVDTIPRMLGPFTQAEVDLELRGAHRPHVVRDDSQRWWVRKPLQARGILAEAIGGLLGRRLGVDVPDFASFDDGERCGWLSAFVREAHHWDRARMGALVNPEALGRMLALDAIIHNEDRNPENFIFEFQGAGRGFRCWAIDMESALVGMPRAFAAKQLKAPRPHALPFDFVLTPPIRVAASDAALVATAVPEVVLHEIVAVAMETAGTLDREPLSVALIARCRLAPQIVKDYLAQFPKSA